MLITLNGRRLCYDLLGAESAPVVCFGHSLAADSGMWAEQVQPLLAAGYSVLRVDLRGHGGSTPLEGAYTIDELADDVIAIADALAVDRFHFIGLSIGGMFGQSLGLRYASRIRSLMLCDSQAATPADAQQRWNPRIAQVLAAQSLEPIADGTMGRWLTEGFKSAHPIRWKQIRDSVVGTTPQGYVGCARAIQNFDFRAQLPSMNIPTLIVVGADDPGAPPTESRNIAALLPQGHYQEIAGARHLPNVEFPDIFNRMTLDWLRAHP
jgi:3-oxoadipate enol-lactonase